MPNVNVGQCSITGESAATPPVAEFKLFGVRIGAPPRIGKSQSRRACIDYQDSRKQASGCFKSRQRKKAKAWSEEEHRLFLKGLKKLGKGKWKAIANMFVQTRSPSQVASHAQKYFIRIGTTKKRCRPSVFDIPSNDTSTEISNSSQSTTRASSERSMASEKILGLQSSIQVSFERFKIDSMTTPTVDSGKPALPPMMRQHEIPDPRTMIFTANPFAVPPSLPILPNLVPASKVNFASAFPPQYGLVPFVGQPFFSMWPGAAASSTQ